MGASCPDMSVSEAEARSGRGAGGLGRLLGRSRGLGRLRLPTREHWQWRPLALLCRFLCFKSIWWLF